MQTKSNQFCVFAASNSLSFSITVHRLWRRPSSSDLWPFPEFHASPESSLRQSWTRCPCRHSSWTRQESLPWRRWSQWSLCLSGRFLGGPPPPRGCPGTEEGCRTGTKGWAPPLTWWGRLRLARPRESPCCSCPGPGRSATWPGSWCTWPPTAEFRSCWASCRADASGWVSLARRKPRWRSAGASAHGCWWRRGGLFSEAGLSENTNIQWGKVGQGQKDKHGCSIIKAAVKYKKHNKLFIW